jgi:hypothetical protein
MGVFYHFVYDPQLKLKGATLRVFVLRDGEYQPVISRIAFWTYIWASRRIRMHMPAPSAQTWRNVQNCVRSLPICAIS